MPVRIGINGFGRMGRLALRAAFDNSQIQIVHINELKGGPETAAHLLEFDSVHGRWRVPIAAEAHGLKINGDRLGYSNFDAPGDVPWDEAGVEIVLECSGKFLTPEALEPYFMRGVRKVVVAAPVKQGALNIVMGVNDQLYDPELHHIVTAASCTTNCLAPVVKVIHKELGITARRHHHHPRRDQYPNVGGLGPQGFAAGAIGADVAGTDNDRVGNRDRSHLPGVAREA